MERPVALGEERSMRAAKVLVEHLCRGLRDRSLSTCLALCGCDQADKDKPIATIASRDESQANSNRRNQTSIRYLAAGAGESLR